MDKHDLHARQTRDRRTTLMRIADTKSSSPYTIGGQRRSRLPHALVITLPRVRFLEKPDPEDCDD